MWSRCTSCIQSMYAFGTTKYGKIQMNILSVSVNVRIRAYKVFIPYTLLHTIVSVRHNYSSKLGNDFVWHKVSGHAILFLTIRILPREMKEQDHTKGGHHYCTVDREMFVVTDF